MIVIEDEKIVASLAYDKLIEALADMFRSDYEMPLRHHHFYKTASGEENTMILMPVWNKQYMGIKQVVVAAKNSEKGLPAIHATYTLLDAETGVPLASMNAAGLTARRTACTSALAAKFLAPENVENLLVVGGGSVAKHLVQAHAVVRNYKKISIWMRNLEKARAFAEELATQGYQVEVAGDLEAAVRAADVVSTATLSPTPIIKGEWLKKGVHLDLIGSHKPNTREVDDIAISGGSIFVDSRIGALHETGDLAIPIAAGVIKADDVQADIVELVKGIHTGRKSNDEKTIFKSAGLAVEDLAAALMVYKNQ